MSRRSLLSLLLLLALTLVPMVALAQDGEQEMETFTSDDGLLTFSYPAGWFIGPYGAEMGGPPFPFVLFSPSQETLDRLNMDEDFAEGDQAMAVVILPAAFFEMVGDEVPAEPTSGDYASLAATMLFGDFEEGPHLKAWTKWARRPRKRLKAKWRNPPRKPPKPLKVKWQSRPRKQPKAKWPNPPRKP